MISNLLALLTANLAFLAAGLGIARIAGIWRDLSGAISYAGVSYMLGVGGIGVVTSLGYVVGLPGDARQTLVECAALAALALVPPRPHVRGWVRSRSSAPAVLAVPLAIALGALFAESVVQALDTWDSWAIWTMKARALVLLDGLDPTLFAGAPYSGAHLDYPLLLPGLEAVDFHFMRALDDRVVHVQLWLLLAGFVSAAERLLRDRAAPLLVWPALLLVVAAPATQTLIEMGYADVPAALFAALAALTAWLYVEEGGTRWAASLGVFAAAAAATKRDTWPFVLLVLLITFAIGRTRRRPLLPVAGASALVGVTIAAWVVWLAAHGVGASQDDVPLSRGLDPVYLLTHAGRAVTALWSVPYYALRPDLWLVLAPVIALALASALVVAPRRSQTLFAAAALGAEYVALVWAFWGSKRPIHWHLEHAAPRVVATALYVGAIFVPLLLERDSGGTLDGAETEPPQIDAPAGIAEPPGPERETRGA
jgi:hypothetical protein